MRAVWALPVLAALAACMDARSPDTLAGQRLEVGDQRLIGNIPIVIHGMSVTVPGVDCDRRGFPVQVLELSADQATARREWAFAAAFNQSMAGNPYYSAAECEPRGSETESYAGPAMEGELTAESFPQTETFEQIFGFEVP